MKIARRLNCHIGSIDSYITQYKDPSYVAWIMGPTQKKRKSDLQFLTAGFLNILK